MILISILILFKRPDTLIVQYRKLLIGARTNHCPAISREEDYEDSQSECISQLLTDMSKIPMA